MDFGFVDLLLLAVVAIGVFLGFKRGFLIVASKPIKIIAALALTFSFAPLLVTGWTGPYFNELFFGRIHEYILTNCPEITAQTAAESMPTVLKIAIALLKIDLTGESAAEGIAAAIAAPE